MVELTLGQKVLGEFDAIYYYLAYHGSQLKNPDISGALYTLRIQYSYTQTQCEDGDRDFRVL